MNTIIISHLDQLDFILNQKLYLSGKQEEEIYYNMWCISLEANIIGSITFEQLKIFVDKLVKSREQQLKDTYSSKNAIFYIWFDKQALQLRFNILTEITPLPFGCKLQLLTAPDSILTSFITTIRNVANYGDLVQFNDEQDEPDEDENNEQYVLNVFAKKLN